MHNEFSGTEIAVVGMDGRFPGANDVSQFWQNLRDGVLSIRPLSTKELDELEIDETTRQDPTYVPVSSAIADYDKFDAPFFDYTPREAEIMDPQQRVFLEACWHALEHAGTDPQQYDGLIGVFAGSTTSNYLIYNLAANRQIFAEVDHGQIDIGNGSDFVATRVSYKLNLRGPSLSIQTACSTSMVAIHLACQSLLNEECDMALAGGVSVHVNHPRGYHFVDGSILSPDGQVRAFDAAANGTVFSGGTGVVVLKRLEDALAQGDSIHAIILGSAISNDGSEKVGYVAPSVNGQAEAIIEAMAMADVDADSIDYVETHGAGTRLGDPIEIRALTKAYRTSTDRIGFCAIGGVKTNIGHLTGAAGVAGFIKTVLSLENKQIPPTLGFSTPNPECFFEQSPFVPNTELKPWPGTDKPRRAGVSSFGLGGTNAHLILQESPDVDNAPRPSRPWQLVTLSAKTEPALAAATTNLTTFLQENPTIDFSDATYTLKVGRQGMRYRRFVVCRDGATAVSQLPDTLVQSVPVQAKRVCFFLPGVTDWQPDGLALSQSEPAFADAVAACAVIWQRLRGVDLRALW
ncbi:MAG: polyketide synthase, partial [Chloroflexi bacterium]|nr:polyketide synthase [Chloroflexota bacterium]